MASLNCKSQTKMGDDTRLLESEGRGTVPVVQSLLLRWRNANFLKKGGAVNPLMISEHFAAACQSWWSNLWMRSHSREVRNPRQILTRRTLHAFRINLVTDMYDVKIFREVREHRCGSVWQGFFVSRFKSHQQQQQKSPPQLCSRVRGSNFQGSPFSKLSANYQSFTPTKHSTGKTLKKRFLLVMEVSFTSPPKKYNELCLTHRTS